MSGSSTQLLITNKTLANKIKFVHGWYIKVSEIRADVNILPINKIIHEY